MMPSTAWIVVPEDLAYGLLALLKGVNRTKVAWAILAAAYEEPRRGEPVSLSYDQIAATTGIAPHCIRRHVRDLEALGVLRTTTLGTGRQRTRTYELVWPPSPPGKESRP